LEITFLGNGDAMGTPRVYCECGVCREARTTGANRRYRSSAWLKTDGAAPLLLDCGPDWRTQMEALGERNAAHGLLTHAHFDHIGGMAEWADACRWLDTTANVYAPAETLAELRVRFPWLESRLKYVPNDAGMAFGAWRAMPWKVNHGKNGHSFAYRFVHEASGKAWAYCSDAISLSDAEKAPLFGLDLLVLGTSFFEEPFPLESRSVYDVKEALELVKELAPRSVLFTHLSHDLDVTQSYALPQNVSFARAGLKVTV
jgi:phosphoribosyl 1,2-cyclic phosphate phosphodiesterase